MKRLAILRHAKSSWADPGMADFDRPLNERGRAAAANLGRELTRRNTRVDLILASPAQRVRETLDGLCAEFPLGEVRFEPQIYEAGVATLLGLIQGLQDEYESVLLAGHNPGLHELVLELTDRDDAGFRDRIRGNYPTGALAMIECGSDRWSDVTRGRGEILDLILPRDLAD